MLTAKFIYGLIRGESKTEGNVKSESGKKIQREETTIGIREKGRKGERHSAPKADEGV